MEKLKAAVVAMVMAAIPAALAQEKSPDKPKVREPRAEILFERKQAVKEAQKPAVEDARIQAIEQLADLKAKLKEAEDSLESARQRALEQSRKISQELRDLRERVRSEARARYP